MALLDAEPQGGQIEGMSTPRTKSELEDLLAKIEGAEGQSERADMIRAMLAEGQ